MAEEVNTHAASPVSISTPPKPGLVVLPEHRSEALFQQCFCSRNRSLIRRDSPARNRSRIRRPGAANMSVDLECYVTTSADPRPKNSRHIGRVVAASLIAGHVAAIVFVAFVFAGAEEHVITGSVLLAFGLRWAMLAVLSMRLTDQPQRWAVSHDCRTIPPFTEAPKPFMRCFHRWLGSACPG